MHADLEKCFLRAIETDFKGVRYQVLEEKPRQGHGRQEIRVYTVIDDPQGLSTGKEWLDL